MEGFPIFIFIFLNCYYLNLHSTTSTNTDIDQ